MRILGVVVVLVLALATQTALAGLTIGATTAVNLVLVVVVYAALAFGPGAGLAAGTLGGLMQDALAGGIIGIGGLSKTIVGFLVGILSTQFIVSQWIPRFIIFAGATLLHELCFQVLHAIIETRGLRFAYAGTLTQAAVNATIGVLAFQVVEWGPGMVQRRRARGSSLSSRRY
jgi:rod shape-determining protein MreD